jgi:hypothetical protein
VQVSPLTITRRHPPRVRFASLHAETGIRDVSALTSFAILPNFQTVFVFSALRIAAERARSVNAAKVIPCS